MHEDPICPLVSVGIPTFNHPEGLEKALKCITSQTYRNLEIIISDNNSPGDKTGQVVSTYLEQDPRITYYKQEVNIGPSPNFQFVLEKSKGDYFMWAADDDEWDPKYIEKCTYALMKNPDAVLSYSDPYFRDYRGWNLFSYECNISSKSRSPVKRAIPLLTRDYPNTPIYGIIRANVIRNMPIMEKYGYDQIIVLMLALTGQIERVEKGLFIYGTKGISSSTKKLLDHQNIDYQARYFLQFSLLVEFIRAVIRIPLKISPFERGFLLALLILKFLIIKDKRHAILYGIEAYIGDKVMGRGI